MSQLPDRLEVLVQDFQECEDQEKLEYLLYLAEQFPPFPERLLAKRDEMVEVPECMTPVHVFTEFDDGKLFYFFDVPQESPTVRGFATFLGAGIRDVSPEEVLAVPADFFLQTGLQHVLSVQRLSGLGGILAHMKQQAVLYLHEDPGSAGIISPDADGASEYGG